jgi:hypothetical protein
MEAYKLHKIMGVVTKYATAIITARKVIIKWAPGANIMKHFSTMAEKKPAWRIAHCMKAMLNCNFFTEQYKLQA